MSESKIRAVCLAVAIFVIAGIQFFVPIFEPVESAIAAIVVLTAFWMGAIFNEQ